MKRVKILKHINKKRVKELLLKHSVLLVIIVVLASLTVPVGLLIVIKWIDGWMNSDFARLKDGINVWFGFWGSYLGAVVSLVLSICTMRLSIKMDRENEKNAIVQQALQFHQFQIKQMTMYNLQKTMTLNILDKLGHLFEGNYIIELKFKETFPVYFNVNVERVEWRNAEGKFEDIQCETIVENSDNFSIYIFLQPNEEQRYDFTYFYYIIYYETCVMSWTEKTRALRLLIQCENRMDYQRRQEDDMRFELNIEFDNKEYNIDNSLKMCVKNTNLMYCHIDN